MEMFFNKGPVTHPLKAGKQKHINCHSAKHDLLD